MGMGLDLIKVMGRDETTLINSQTALIILSDRSEHPTYEGNCQPCEETK